MEKPHGAFQISCGKGNLPKLTKFWGRGIAHLDKLSVFPLFVQFHESIFTCGASLSLYSRFNYGI